MKHDKYQLYVYILPVEEELAAAAKRLAEEEEIARVVIPWLYVLFIQYLNVVVALYLNVFLLYIFIDHDAI